VSIENAPHVQELEALVHSWHRLMASTPSAGTAASLYQGRSIAVASAVAAQLSGRLHIVSAGLGLVSENQSVPSYECTIASGSWLGDSLERLGATTADWWDSLTASHPHPLSRLISQGPTLLALPSTYLRMVSKDLSQLTIAQASHLRIFTSTAGAKLVPPRLADCTMPYDDRLESVPGYAGTRADFAQRALRHFVVELRAEALPREEARAKVTAALARWHRPRQVQGARLSDDEIRQVLRRQWDCHEGRSSRLLRYLRDEAGISCEQKRFSRIWQSLAIEVRG
jgi:hypothetical protein